MLCHPQSDLQNLQDFSNLDFYNFTFNALAGRGLHYCKAYLSHVLYQSSFESCISLFNLMYLSPASSCIEFNEDLFLADFASFLVSIRFISEVVYLINEYTNDIK